MGADFSEKVKGTFKKHLDKSLVALNTPELFDKNIDKVSRSFRADLVGDQKLTVGQKIMVRANNGCLVAMDALTPVATCPDPPDSILRGVVDGAGIAYGRVAQNHEIAGVVEIECDFAPAK